MIVGARHWHDRGTWYVQTNDLLEEIRRKLGDAHILQSCGSDQACSCLEAVGWDLSGKLATKSPAGYVVPPDDLLTGYLNNPRNYALLETATGIDPRREPNNRHSAMLVVGARALWGAVGVHRLDLTPAIIRAELLLGHAVEACLVPPGHYEAVVAWDQATDELIYNDSRPDRKREWLGDGFNRRMTADEEKALAWEGVVWLPPGGG